MAAKAKAADTPTLMKTGLAAIAAYEGRVRALDHRSLARWAADCAGHVLPHFKRERPDDDRPGKAIAAARAWARGALPMMGARAAAVAAHAAARACVHPAAVAAARAAGHAAGTAHAKGHARAAAAYAILAAASRAPERAQGRIRAEQRRQAKSLGKRRSPDIAPPIRRGRREDGWRRVNPE